MRRSVIGLAAFCAASVVHLGSARADDDTSLVIGGDGDLSFSPEGAGENVEGAGGGGLRLGVESDVLYFLYARGEIGGDYHTFGGERAPDLWRGTGGLRIGLEFLLRVGVFAHAGVGSLDSPGADESRKAFTYDVGAELGIGLLPLLDLGLHYAYVRLDAGDAPRDFAFQLVGIHVELAF